MFDINAKNNEMKTLKIIMLFTGFLSFVFGTYNIVFLNLPNQWFGFISGAFLVWLFFNIDKIITRIDRKAK